MDIAYIIIGCVVVGVILYAIQGYQSNKSFRPSDGSIARENPGAVMNSKFGSNAYPSKRHGVDDLNGDDDNWGVNPNDFKDGGKRRHRRRRRKSKRH